MALTQDSRFVASDSNIQRHTSGASSRSDFVSLLENHFGAQSLQSFLADYRGSRGVDTMTTPQFLEYLNQNLFKGDQAGWRELRVNDWFLNGRTHA